MGRYTVTIICFCVEPSTYNLYNDLIVLYLSYQRKFW